MDTVWVDTMFPGIDPDEGWEKNLERVVNYDYLLKEYLDWQLKHLTTDNFDQVDWSNVTADIISMAAGSVDLTAYYDKDEVDAKAQLILAAAEDYATAEISAKVGDIGSATVKAYADNQIAGLSLVAQGSGNTARLSLMSGQTELGNGASLGLSVTNNSNGYSYLKLTSGGIDLATSGNITLGGNVVFASGSGTTKNLSYTTISGGTVTTNTITALNITANNIVANASISSPTITGGYFYSSDKDSYLVMNANGWSMHQKTGGTMYKRAYLAADAQDKVTLIMGDSSPKLKLEKYFSGGHYLFLGNDDGTHGLTINLGTGAYSFS